MAQPTTNYATLRGTGPYSAVSLDRTKGLLAAFTSAATASEVELMQMLTQLPLETGRGLLFACGGDAGVTFALVHRVSRVPGDPGVAAPLDGLSVGVLGDLSDEGISSVDLSGVPWQAMTVHRGPFRVKAARALEEAIIEGAGLVMGPYEASDGDTEEIAAVRAACVVPSELLPLLLADTRWDLVNFYEKIISPILTGPNAPAYQDFLDWFRVVSTQTLGSGKRATPKWTPMVNILTKYEVFAPSDRPRARKFILGLVRGDLASLDQAAHAQNNGQTGHALTEGFAQLTASNEMARLEATARADAAALRKQDEAAAKTRISTSKRTAHMQVGLKIMLEKVSDVALDSTAPAFWVEFAAAPDAKGDQAMLQRRFDARAQAADSVIGMAGAVPIATVKRVGLVRTGQFGSPDLSNLGEGISPFTTRTSHESDGAKAKEQALIYARSEQGNATLNQTEQFLLTSHDGVSFPVHPLSVSERIKCFSVEVDVILGATHPVAMDLQLTAHRVAGSLSMLHNAFPEDGGMSTLQRIMVFVHQRVGNYFRSVQLSAGGGVDDPRHTTMNRELTELFNYTAWHMLPHIPAVYLHTVREETSAVAAASPGRTNSGRKGGSSGSKETASGSPAKDYGPRVVNEHVNAALKERWGKSGYTTMRALFAKNHDHHPLPKVANGGDVCLSWMLRGACYEKCDRSGAHGIANAGTVKNVHAYLDKLGVPKSDE